MNVLQTYYFRQIGILFPFDKRRSTSTCKKRQGAIFLSLIETTQNQRQKKYDTTYI